MRDDDFHELLPVVDAWSSDPPSKFDRELRRRLLEELYGTAHPPSPMQLRVSDIDRDDGTPHRVDGQPNRHEMRPRPDKSYIMLAAAMVAVLVCLVGLLFVVRDGAGVVETFAPDTVTELLPEESGLPRETDPDLACERLAESAPSLREMMTQLEGSSPVPDESFADAESALRVLLADFEVSDQISQSQRDWNRVVLGSVFQSREENRLGEFARAAASLGGVVNQLGRLPSKCEQALF